MSILLCSFGLIAEEIIVFVILLTQTYTHKGFYNSSLLRKVETIHEEGQYDLQPLFKRNNRRQCITFSLFTVNFKFYENAGLH